MDVGSLIADLKNEAERISRAIAALTGLGATKPRGKRKVGASRGPAVSKKKRGGGMTPAGRKRLSMLMKKRWAERKRKGSQKL
jgi:hypothetical protein